MKRYKPDIADHRNLSDDPRSLNEAEGRAKLLILRLSAFIWVQKSYLKFAAWLLALCVLCLRLMVRGMTH